MEQPKKVSRSVWPQVLLWFVISMIVTALCWSKSVRPTINGGFDSITETIDKKWR